jgi:hypothetical protein
MVAANCFVCMSRSILDPFLVLYQIKGFCQHSRSNFSPIPTFKISKIALIINLSVTLALLIPAASYLPVLETLCATKKSLCFVLIGDEIFLISNILLEIITAAKMETVHQEMLTWLNIFEHRKFYSLDIIVDENKVKKFITVRTIGVMVAAWFVVVEALYFFSDNAYDNLPWSNARKIALLVGTIFESFITFEAYHRIFTKAALLDAMKTALHKTCFTRDFNVFKKQVLLMAAMNSNTKSIMNLMTALLLLWISTTIGFLIFNIYALIDYASYNVFTVMLTQLKTISFITSCGLFFYVHDENLKRKVSFFWLQLLQFYFFAVSLISIF